MTDDILHFGNQILRLTQALRNLSRIVSLGQTHEAYCALESYDQATVYDLNQQYCRFCL